MFLYQSILKYPWNQSSTPLSTLNWEKTAWSERLRMKWVARKKITILKFSRNFPFFAFSSQFFLLHLQRKASAERRKRNPTTAKVKGFSFLSVLRWEKFLHGKSAFVIVTLDNSSRSQPRQMGDVGLQNKSIKQCVYKYTKRRGSGMLWKYGFSLLVGAVWLEN